MGFIQKIRQAFASKSTISIAALTSELEEPSLDVVLSEQFQTSIAEEFPNVQLEQQDNGLMLQPYGLLLVSAVLERTVHPDTIVLAVGVRLYHAQYFSSPLTECVAGIGEDDLAAIRKGVENFLSSVLSVVIEAFEGCHTPELDITSAVGEVLWHPILSAVYLQGMWTQRVQEIDEKYWLSLIKDNLLLELVPQSFHWVKIYASIMPDGSFIGECKLNSEAWETGLSLVQSEAEKWDTGGSFAAQKQFIFLRKCGLH